MTGHPSSDHAPQAPAAADLGLAPFHGHGDTLYTAAGEFGSMLDPVVLLHVDGDVLTLASVLAARASTLARLVLVCRALGQAEAPAALRAIEPIAEDLAELCSLVGARLAREQRPAVQAALGSRGAA